VFNADNTQPVLEMGEAQAVARTWPWGRGTCNPALGRYRSRLSSDDDPSGCTSCCSGPTHICQSRAHPEVRSRREASNHVQRTRFCEDWRAVGTMWTRFCMGWIPAKIPVEHRRTLSLSSISRPPRQLTLPCPSLPAPRRWGDRAEEAVIAVQHSPALQTRERRKGLRRHPPCRSSIATGFVDGKGAPRRQRRYLSNSRLPIVLFYALTATFGFARSDGRASQTSAVRIRVWRPSAL